MVGSRSCWLDPDKSPPTIFSLLHVSKPKYLVDLQLGYCRSRPIFREVFLVLSEAAIASFNSNLKLFGKDLNEC